LSGSGGGWHACIVQFQVGGSANTTTVRFNVWKDGVELQDATGAARKVWDDNAAADNMDRFTLGAQQHAGAVASGRFFGSWIGRSFWCEDFLDDAEVAEITAWLQATAYVAPSFAVPFTPVFRVGARTSADTAAPDGGPVWLTPANAAADSPISATLTLGGGGESYQDSGGAAGYSYDASVNRLRLPAGAFCEWEQWGNPVTMVISGVPNGPARVNLTFREAYFTTAGSRVFNITLNGVPVETDFDIAAAVGADVVICKSYDVTVTAGTITVVLDASVDNAQVTGIEVLV
jgi:hypothetical protein